MATGLKTGGRTKGTPNKPKATAVSAPASDTIFPLAREAPPATASPFPRYRLANVADLVPYDKNPRLHSAAQIDQLAGLITEYGWTNPVLVDGKRGVIAGHGRVLAAKKLGLDVVPTIELSHLSAAQRRAYVIADNASALQSSWDDELLLGELTALKDLGFDLGLTGFDGAELDSLFATGNEGLTDQDDADNCALDGKVCCPSCGHEFATVDKAFRLMTTRKQSAA